jgi:hypothetical protein
MTPVPAFNPNWLCGTRHSVPCERSRDVTIHRLTHLPMEEPRDSLRTERADLDEFVLGVHIAESCFTRKPASRTQHEYVNGGTRDVLSRVVECPVLPNEAANQGTRQRRPDGTAVESRLIGPTGFGR